MGSSPLQRVGVKAFVGWEFEAMETIVFAASWKELGATTSIKLVICNFYGCYGGWGTANNTHGFFLGLGGTVQLRQHQQRHERRCGRDRDPHCAAGEASLLLPPHGVALRRQHHPELSYVKISFCSKPQTTYYCCFFFM